MEHLSHLIETSPDAILVKTPTEIVYANRAALALFGAPAPEDLLGRAPLDLIAPEDHEEVLALLLPPFQGQEGPPAWRSPCCGWTAGACT